MQMTLTAARVNVNLSQKAAAKKLKISNKTLSYWENGMSFPDATQIPKLCELYGVSYDDLIFLPANPLKGE